MEERIQNDEQQFIIKETRDVLEKTIQAMLSSPSTADAPSHAVSVNDLTFPITDALIRYQEGISCSLRSREEEGSPDAEVQWISQDGQHAICLTKALKDFLVNLFADGVVKLICHDLQLSSLILSTFIQAMISLYMEYKRKLPDTERYVLALCYYLSAKKNIKIFTAATLVSFNLQFEGKEGYSVLTEEIINECITSLKQYGFFEPCGDAYRIIY